MIYIEENRELKPSCSVQLPNVLAMPPGLKITNLQISEYGYDSNHTTPLNYMQRVTPTSHMARFIKSAEQNEHEKNCDLDVENNFQNLQLNSTPSSQNNLPEMQKHHSYESSDSLRLDAHALRERSFDNNNREYGTGTQTDSQRFGATAEQQPEGSTKDNYAQSRRSGERPRNTHSLMVQAPEDYDNSNNHSASLPPYAHYIHNKQQQHRVSQNKQPHQASYQFSTTAPTIPTSAVNTPSNTWSHQQQQHQQQQHVNTTYYLEQRRTSTPATSSVLSSYATAPTSSARPKMPKQDSPPLPLVPLVPLVQHMATTYHSTQPLQQQFSSGEYALPYRSSLRSNSPPCSSSDEEARLLAERASYLQPQQHQQQLQHQQLQQLQQLQPMPTVYSYPHLIPPQQASLGYVTSPPPPNQYGQQTYQSAASYYPPGHIIITPPHINNSQPDLLIYQVQFKRCSKSYTNRSGDQVHLCDFVVVEGDRGEDLGVVIEIFSLQEYMHRHTAYQRYKEGFGDKSKSEYSGSNSTYSNNNIRNTHTVECILRLASQQERQQLPFKFQSEKNIVHSSNELAMHGFGLPIMVYDAEFQFDRNKLTLYYECHERIDFRDFVRQLYATYKARIWMKIGDVNTPVKVQPLATMALATGVHFSEGTSTAVGGYSRTVGSRGGEGWDGF